MRKEETFYIPSLNSNVKFKELTIGQYKNIIQKNNSNPFLNIGFNLALLDTLQQNNIDNKPLTCFDKYIIAYQLRCYVFEREIPYKSIEHPKSRIIQEIECRPPGIEEDKNYYEYINLFNKDQTEELLFAEIAKYIAVNNYQTLEQKIYFLKKQPVKILASYIDYIDNVKNIVKQYYIKNNGQLIEYGIKLLLP